MIDAAEVGRAVLAVPGVVGLDPGPYGTASTFTAAGRIWGVRLGPDELHLHIVIDTTQPLPMIARQIRSAVRALPDTPAATRIAVHAEDLVLPTDVDLAPPVVAVGVADPAVAWRGDTHPL